MYVTVRYSLPNRLTGRDDLDAAAAVCTTSTSACVYTALKTFVEMYCCPTQLTVVSNAAADQRFMSPSTTVGHVDPNAHQKSSVRLRNRMLVRRCTHLSQAS